MSRTIDLKYDEKENKWTGVVEAEKPSEVAEKDNAKLAQAGVLAGVAGIEVMGIPLGQAALGLALSTLAVEIISGFTKPEDKMMRVVGKGLAVLGANWKPVKDVTGSKAAEAASLILAASIVGDVIPLDEWIRDLVSRVKGIKVEKKPESPSAAPSLPFLPSAPRFGASEVTPGVPVIEDVISSVT